MEERELLPASDSDVRGLDAHGEGYYGAPRGSRTHKGIDLVCDGGTLIQSCCDGVVSRCDGVVYSDPEKSDWRYVQVTDLDGNHCRYMYVKQWDIDLGQKVKRGDVIGVAQGIETLYEGIVGHLHFEVRRNKSVYLNPTEYLKELESKQPSRNSSTK